MTLDALLAEKKTAVLKRWIELIFDSYPPDTSRFLTGVQDRFQNPVGHAVTQGLGGLLDEVTRGYDEEKILPHLDFYVRIRSVQDFSPSQAVSFVFLLKQALREHMAPEIERQGLLESWLDLDARLDRLALAAFESYVRSREKLGELIEKQRRDGPFKKMDRSCYIRLADKDKRGEDL